MNRTFFYTKFNTICVVDSYSDVCDHIFNCSVYLIFQSKIIDLKGAIHYEAED